MNKEELIEAVAAQSDMAKDAAGKAVDALLKTVTEVLHSQKKVSLIGFGTFTVRERVARTGRNPSTGEVIQIPAAKIPAFKPDKAFRDAVGNDRTGSGYPRSKEEGIEKVRRLEPLPETKRQLFLLSGNKCAFLGCEQILLDQSGHFVGEICHIEAANEGGERFNPKKTNEQRRHISNLVLMCPTHHGVTDKVSEFPVSRMQEIKHSHESKAYSDNGLTSSEIETFVDATFLDVAPILNNVNELPLNDYGLMNSEIISSVNSLIQVVSRIPRQTRSLYAHCILASFGDDSLEFDPREVRNRLGVTDNVVIEHAVILQRYRLMSDVDNDDHPHRLSQYIISPQSNDNQILYFTTTAASGTDTRPTNTLFTILT